MYRFPSAIWVRGSLGAIFTASWCSLILGRPGLVAGLLSLAGLTLGTILIGFCVQHDANHGAYFRTRRANHLMGWSADALLGFSSYAWRVKHNVAHHTYTNVDGYDDDIDQMPFARLTPTQARRSWHRLQHVSIWPLYSVMVSRWQIGADIAAFATAWVGITFAGWSAWLLVPLCIQPSLPALYLPAASFLIYLDPAHNRLIWPALLYGVFAVLAVGSLAWTRLGRRRAFSFAESDAMTEERAP